MNDKNHSVNAIFLGFPPGFGGGGFGGGFGGGPGGFPGGNNRPFLRYNPDTDTYTVRQTNIFLCFFFPKNERFKSIQKKYFS